jgi:hypothetical protein
MEISMEIPQKEKKMLKIELLYNPAISFWVCISKQLILQYTHVYFSTNHNSQNKESA